jgi:hypothetical protein
MILSIMLTFAFAQIPDLNSLQGVRPEVLNTSDDYLNTRVSKTHYYQALDKWNQLGWSNEEKDIVVDTLQKSFDDSQLKDQWLCNLKPHLYCSKKTYFSMLKWPEYLEHYDTLLFAGQSYPKHQWNSLILNGKNRYTFISSRYSSIEHYGEAHSFRFPDQPKEMTTLSEKPNQPSFYKKHKRKIWWTVGGVLIASGLFSLAGKKIVITQIGF